jgi:hypothetical protein
VRLLKYVLAYTPSKSMYTLNIQAEKHNIRYTKRTATEEEGFA